jgi:hypothetical protein
VAQSRLESRIKKVITNAILHRAFTSSGARKSTAVAVG